MASSNEVFMKITLVLLLFASSVVLAEQIATTEDGKKVVLKDDGTWAYMEANALKKEAGDEYANSAEVIKEKCMTDWPADFEMRVYCEKQQREAVLKLKEGKPKDIGSNEYVILHKKCATEWVQDYEMRAYCEKQQFEALRELRR
jgi:hypothetical protein